MSDTHASLNHPKPKQSRDLVMLSVEVQCSPPLFSQTGAFNLRQECMTLKSMQCIMYMVLVQDLE